MSNLIYFVSTYDDGDDYSETVFMSQEPSEVLKFIFGNESIKNQKPLWIENGRHRQYALVWQIEEGFYKEKRLIGVWGDADYGKSWQKFWVDENETIYFDGCTIPKNNLIGPYIGLFKAPDEGEGVPEFPIDIKEYIKTIGKAFGH